MLQQILECGLQKSIPTQGEVHYCNILYGSAGFSVN